MEELFAYIAQRIHLELALKEQLPVLLQYQECSKGTLLLAAGRVCRRLWFLERGVVRRFLRTPEEDLTTWLYVPFTAIYAGNSFTERSPSDEGFQVLEAAQLWWISYDDLQRLQAAFPAVEELHQKIAAQYVSELKSLSYVRGLVSLQGRFTWLKTHFPDLIYTVDPLILASFIRISRRSFYNLKKKPGNR